MTSGLGGLEGPDAAETSRPEPEDKQGCGLGPRQAGLGVSDELSQSSGLGPGRLSASRGPACSGVPSAGERGAETRLQSCRELRLNHAVNLFMFKVENPVAHALPVSQSSGN